MTFKLPPEKCQGLIDLCQEILVAKTISIRKFAQHTGKCVAAEPGVQYAALYFKTFAIERDHALKVNRGNFDAKMCISLASRECI